ncbi:MAG: binding-protein-dependent transport system inner rane protein [Geminicoccaceae bacterium]|nr:binding-protein-dependent transport system inner rane protein [Geminicoccaceae bacterium]
MAQPATTLGPKVASSADGVPLKARLRRAERLSRLKAYALLLPLFAFILVTFFLPILVMLFRSVQNPELATHFPQTLALLRDWDPASDEPPSEAVFSALAAEIAAAHERRELGRVATRLNYEESGTRSLLTKTGRSVADMEAPEVDGSWRATFLDIDEDWGDAGVWAAIKNYGTPYTLGYFLAALDLRYGQDGGIVAQPERYQIYVQVFLRTVWLSALVTVLCLLLGYPVAYLLATVPTGTSNLLMILVLLPFWTSLLVRTTAWVVVLQTEGVLNDLLIFLNVIDERVQLIFNRFGVVVAMTHILLPFMILPIFSVMKTISPSYLRAAQSLGARPFTAFWRVYFPQTVPGIGAGGILVFILALGYYITPALVGGPTDQMISYFIADHTNRSLNWGLASAMGAILLIGVLAMYLLYNRLVGIDNMKLG